MAFRPICKNIGAVRARFAVFIGRNLFLRFLALRVKFLELRLAEGCYFLLESLDYAAEFGDEAQGELVGDAIRCFGG